MTDAEKLKDLMKARNLSQNAFAKETGVAQSYISYIVNGKNNITEKIAKKICNSLGIDMSYFQDSLEEKPKEEEKPIPVITRKFDEISFEDEKIFGDILEISKQITELRKQLLEKIKEDREKDKYYNGIDQDFLHYVENLDKLSDKEAIDIILKEKESRKNRRNVKQRIFVIQGLLNAITNPDLFQLVLYSIKKTKNFEYKVRNEINNEEKTNG